jgi:hypothetical protein
MELRYFGGLSDEKVAAVLSISRSTVTRVANRADVAAPHHDHRARSGCAVNKAVGWARVRCRWRRTSRQDALKTFADTCESEQVSKAI